MERCLLDDLLPGSIYALFRPPEAKDVQSMSLVFGYPSSGPGIMRSASSARRFSLRCKKT